MAIAKREEVSYDEIDRQNPFSDDKLGVRGFAESFANIVSNATGPFVFNINSPYGTGKSFLLKRLRVLLENKGHKVMFYNAWESDFYDNPLIPIIASMQEQFVIGDPVWDHVKKAGDALLESIPVLGDLHNNIKCKNSTPSLDKYNEILDNKTNFIKNITLAAESLPKQLIIVVDELDRCRPDYAIKTLETIKHFFNIKNIIFILAVDRVQLENTVGQFYGTGNQTEYLRKFIDQDFYLPIPENKVFVKYLCEQYLTDEINRFIKENDNPTTNPGYKLRICTCMNKEIANIPDRATKKIPEERKKEMPDMIINIFCTYVSALSDYFSFSFRTQEQVIIFIKIFLLNLDYRKDLLIPELLSILVCIKYFKNIELEALLYHGHWIELFQYPDKGGSLSAQLIKEIIEERKNKYGYDKINADKIHLINTGCTKNNSQKISPFVFWMELLQKIINDNPRDYIYRNNYMINISLLEDNSNYPIKYLDQVKKLAAIVK